MAQENYPRDLVGYASNPPADCWPGGARVALQFVLNYEEGGESSVLHGDPGAEKFLSEIIAAPEVLGARHMSMESLFDFGARVGVWRVLRLFEECHVPLTIFAVAMAMQRNPAVVEAMVKAGHEICGHGYRWIDYQDVPIDIEREHLQKAIEIQEQLTGSRPLGWYTGRTSPHTRHLVVEDGGFVYDADDYNDELPYWQTVSGKRHLVVPYTLDANDMRFSIQHGFITGDHFFQYLKDTFDELYREGENSPRMMSVGLHARIVGRPGRVGALRRFIEYVQTHDEVWFCRRLDIARHWQTRHPAA